MFPRATMIDGPSVLVSIWSQEMALVLLILNHTSTVTSTSLDPRVILMW